MKDRSRESETPGSLCSVVSKLPWITEYLVFGGNKVIKLTPLRASPDATIVPRKKALVKYPNGREAMSALTRALTELDDSSVPFPSKLGVWLLSPLSLAATSP